MSDRAGRQIGFRTTKRDELILEAVSRTKYGSLSLAAQLRMALEGWAESQGIWDPEAHINEGKP